MFSDFLKAAQKNYDAQEPFAMAMVVRRKIPSSGKPGDKAIIKPDGSLIGWIGGGCTRGIVIKEGLAAIQEGKPRLLRISLSDNLPEVPGVIDYKMTCLSGGTVEVYIEPVLPAPHLIIAGKSHVAMALSKLARVMNYSISAFGQNVDAVMFPDADHWVEDVTQIQHFIKPQSFIVVCTQGEEDEKALESALRTEAPYVAFVSSRRKANGIFKYLRQAGIPIERLQQVKTPAGLDIQAQTHEEVAVSILAQIIEFRRSDAYRQTVDKSTTDAKLSDDLFINPVCGVPVQKSSAKHVIEFGGEQYYFCCDGCKISFENEPEKYTASVNNE